MLPLKKINLRYVRKKIITYRWTIFYVKPFEYILKLTNITRSILIIISTWLKTRIKGPNK